MLVWIASAALAGGVYVNGTYVEPRALAGVSLSGATVRFDDQGNIRIDAPGYKIQLAPNGTAATQPVPVPRPATPPAPVSEVAYGRWWIVTEDKASSGHIVDVYVNDQLAATIRSGKGGEMVELSKWLHLGTNQIVVRSSSTNAGGGSLTVYVGAGGTQSGAFSMPDPTVEYGLSASRSGSAQRTYTLTVDK